MTEHKLSESGAVAMRARSALVQIAYISPESERIFDEDGAHGVLNFVRRIAREALSEDDEMMQGAERIAAERCRQIDVEGWSPQHDESHHEGQLALAASSYAYHAFRQAIEAESLAHNTGPVQWPWEMESWKPSDDPIRNLEKAGALIAAEIDRLLAEGKS